MTGVQGVTGKPKGLLPLMAVGTLLADFCLHLGSTRAMETGDIRLLLRLGFNLVFLGFRATGFLEDHAFGHYLFYIHITQMLSVLPLLPKQIPSAIPPYNRLLPANLPYRYIH